MGIVSNISLEVIWIQCIWLQLLTAKPACFMKKRIRCWQEYKSNCHPWHFHFSFSRQGEFWCLGLSGRRAQLSCRHSAVPKARRCQEYWKQKQTGSSFSTANVLSIVSGAMIWLSQSPLSIYCILCSWTYIARPVTMEEQDLGLLPRLRLENLRHYLDWKPKNTQDIIPIYENRVMIQ